MPEDIYEVLALGLRYWFALLGLVIVWRAFVWLRKDRRARHRRLRQLPDAGMVGELVVVRGGGELPEGTVIPVPQEGVMGFLRTCDVVVPLPGVAARHADFSFEEGLGLLLKPWRGQRCLVAGEEITARDRPKAHPLCHGDTLEVGEAALRLRLFAGLAATRRAAFAPEEEPEAQPQAQPTQGWPMPGNGAWQDAEGYMLRGKNGNGNPYVTETWYNDESNWQPPGRNMDPPAAEYGPWMEQGYMLRPDSENCNPKVTYRSNESADTRREVPSFSREIPGGQTGFLETVPFRYTAQNGIFPGDEGTPDGPAAEEASDGPCPGGYAGAGFRRGHRAVPYASRDGGVAAPWAPGQSGGDAWAGWDESPKETSAPFAPNPLPPEDAFPPVRPRFRRRGRERDADA